MRFARVCVTPVGSETPLWLITDAEGRLSYRLPAGDYRVRTEHTPESGFHVGRRGWTSVRIGLD